MISVETNLLKHQEKVFFNVLNKVFAEILRCCRGKRMRRNVNLIFRQKM